MHRRQRRATNLNLPGKVKTGAPGASQTSQSGSLYCNICTSFLFKHRSPRAEPRSPPLGEWGSCPAPAVEAGAG